MLFRSRVAALGQKEQESLLDKAQMGAGMLELGKLTALEKYYLDVIAPFVAELDLNAEVVSASPSRTVADATEVTVEMTLTYAPEKPVLGPHNAISSLRQIVNGDFWLPHQRTTMEALNLPA